MIISVQHFTVWFSIEQGAITIIVLPKGYNEQVTTYGAYSNFKCNINRFQTSDAMWFHKFHLSLLCILLPIDYISLLSTLHWSFYARLCVLKSPNIWTTVPVLVWFVGVAAAAPTKEARTGTFVHIYMYTYMCVCVCVCLCVFVFVCLGVWNAIAYIDRCVLCSHYFCLWSHLNEKAQKLNTKSCHLFIFWKLTFSYYKNGSPLAALYTGHMSRQPSVHNWRPWWTQSQYPVEYTTW
jgi:hypothetical protein